MKCCSNLKYGIWIRLMLLCLVVIQSGSVSLAQFKVVADTGGAWFLDGKLPFGIEFDTENGVHKRTVGYMKGSVGWRLFDISCSSGVVKKGVIFVDLEKVKASNNQLIIVARHKKKMNFMDTLIVKIPAVKSIRFMLDENQPVTPGASFFPAVQLKYSNGILYTCKPWSDKSMINPDALQLYYGKQLVTDGRIAIAQDVQETMVNPVISVILRENPEVFDFRELPLTFTEAETIYYSELPASSGKDGAPGVDGLDGRKGEDGASGADARLLKIYLSLDKDSSLLRVKTDYENIVNEYSLIPAATQLNVIIKGGDGGNGGNGGEGAKGVAGKAELGGRGGDGGNGGRGGKGGSIVIHVTPEAEKYLPQLNINNSGGVGGNGGKGGRGGKTAVTEGSSLFEILFPGRNKNGKDGLQGDYGENGPPAEILPWNE